MKAPWKSIHTAPMDRHILMGRPGFESWIGLHPHYYGVAEGWMEIPNMNCRECENEPMGGSPFCKEHQKVPAHAKA
jgi:hypothetical protein